MARIESFTDLIIWQNAKKLFLELHAEFKDHNEYYLRDQILKAALSISNNIAEGFERKSQKEYARFIYSAKGSCGEVRSMLYIAKELNFISSMEFDELYSLSKMISSKLMNLIRRLIQP